MKERSASGSHERGVKSPSGNARTRTLVALGGGLLAFAVAMLWTPWQISALIGWNVTATVFIGWVWLSVGGMGGEATAAHAAIEDVSRRTADLILILAAIGSLVGVGLSLLETSDQQGVAKALTTAVASATVILSWATVHTIYALLRTALLLGWRRHRLQGRPLA